MKPHHSSPYSIIVSMLRIILWPHLFDPLHMSKPSFSMGLAISNCSKSYHCYIGQCRAGAKTKHKYTSLFLAIKEDKGHYWGGGSFSTFNREISALTPSNGRIGECPSKDWQNLGPPVHVIF